MKKLWTLALAAVLCLTVTACKEEEPIPDIVLTSAQETAFQYMTAIQLQDWKTIQDMVGIQGGKMSPDTITNWFVSLEWDWLEQVDLDAARADYVSHAKKPELPMTISETSSGDLTRVVYAFDITEGEGKEATTSTYEFIVKLQGEQIYPENGFKNWPQVVTPIQGVCRYGTLLESEASGSGFGYVIAPDLWYDVPVVYEFHDSKTEQAQEPIEAKQWQLDDGTIQLSLECTDTQNVNLRSAVHAQMNLALEYMHLDHNVITDPIDPVDEEAELKAYKRLSKKDKEAYDIRKAEELELALIQAQENLENKAARMDVIDSIMLWNPEVWANIKSVADDTMDNIQQYKIKIVPNDPSVFPESVQLDYDVFKVKTAVTAVLKGASSGTDEAHMFCFFTVRLNKSGDYIVENIEFPAESNPFIKVNRFVRDW